MKAYQMVEWQQPPEMRDVDVPEPGPGEILVEVAGAGACHSDLHIMEWPAGMFEATMALAAAVSQPDGEVTVVGLAGGVLPYQFGVLPWDCAITTPYWGSAVELMEVLDLARAGKIRAHVERFGLDQVEEAYQRLRDGTLAGRAVIVP